MIQENIDRFKSLFSVKNKHESVKEYNYVNKYINSISFETNDKNINCTTGDNYGLSERIIPVIQLDFQLLANQNDLRLINKINQLEHTVEFGYHPNERINYDLPKNQVTPTGKKYISGIGKNGKIIESLEYDYNDNKYVYVRKKGFIYDIDEGLKIPVNGFWYKVNPITWKIENWNQMPETINPHGDGSATSIILRAEQGLICDVNFDKQLTDELVNSLKNQFVQNVFSFLPSTITKNEQFIDSYDHEKLLSKPQDLGIER